MNNIKIKPFLAWQIVDGDAVIIDSRGNKQIHRLNPMATKIWNEVVNGFDLEQIVENLSSQFDVSNDVLTQDVNEFLNDLQNKGLLELG